MPRRTPRPSTYRRRLDTSSLRVLAPTWTPPNVGPVAVVGVQVVSATVLRWTFSVPISAIPAVANLAPLTARDATSAATAPTAVIADGASALRLTYASLTFSSTATWAVTSAPSGLTFANAASVALPQSGPAANPFAAALKRSRSKRPTSPLSSPAAASAPTLPLKTPSKPSRRAA